MELCFIVLQVVHDVKCPRKGHSPEAVSSATKGRDFDNPIINPTEGTLVQISNTALLQLAPLTDSYCAGERTRSGTSAARFVTKGCCTPAGEGFPAEGCGNRRQRLAGRVYTSPISCMEALGRPWAHMCIIQLEQNFPCAATYLLLPTVIQAGQQTSVCT